MKIAGLTQGKSKPLGSEIDWRQWSSRWSTNEVDLLANGGGDDVVEMDFRSISKMGTRASV